MQATSKIDRMIGTLLFVKPSPIIPAADDSEANADASAQAERRFSMGLMFSGVRCILQYAVLPFVLPLIGLAGDFSVIVSLTINVIAIVAIVSSLRRFWQINYRRKWQYLPVAMVALILLVSFIVLDIAIIAQA